MTVHYEDIYRSPLKIPEGRKGKFRIKHKTYPVGHEHVIVSMRDFVFTGEQANSVRYDVPTMFHELHEGRSGK